MRTESLDLKIKKIALGGLSDFSKKTQLVGGDTEIDTGFITLGPVLSFPLIA